MDKASLAIIPADIPPTKSATLPQISTEQPSILPTAAYLHIPFCQTHCRYCDFAVTIGTEDLIEKYVQYLLQEIAFTPTELQGLETVYFGGGTPSLLSSNQLERLIDALSKRFGISANAEISLEANPGTFDRAKLQAYQRAGINRLSLGVQAFQDHLLRLCGRSHGVAEVYASVKIIQELGFDNFNLDLIFGLPEQSLADWEASLQAVLAIAPTHVSLYDLIIEENTPFGRLYQTDRPPLPTDEETVEMYLKTIEVLGNAGYEHYEIANFARPGYQCKHNRVYWKNQPYYGLGVGATGYVYKQRVERPRNLYEYFTWVETGQFTVTESVTSQEELTDTLLLGLRLTEGIMLESLDKRFGKSLVAQMLHVLQPSIDSGYMQVIHEKMQLIVPQGFLFSNEVFALLT
ncbi:MAG: coproporphyrinogen III oxidase [Anaerolineae bacterium]|nr:coproporphyrinogen III oxidase [Gloeobacterales cyanobacterium ES-bin-313]